MHFPETIEDLAPAPYNPRRIGDGAAAGLSASISRFGDIAGIVYNARTKQLVCGHQRVSQLRALGAQLFKEQTGDVVLRVGRDGKRFAVRVVDWSEDEEKAANITANNPRITGEFTDDLQSLLSSVELAIGKVDFDALELSALVDSVPNFDDDEEQPPLDETSKTTCPKCGAEF